MNSAKNVSALYISLPFVIDITGVSNGSVTGSTANVTATINVNNADVGKTASTYVTAIVPATAVDNFVPQHAGRRYAEAATTSRGNVLIQLTGNGWQRVSNGQLTPYSTGVLTAIQALSNAITASLAGAQFCVGYGTSADEMISAGRIEPIARIDDANATASNTGSCLNPLNFPLVVQQGWNLLGNSLNQTFQVADLYGNSNWVTSVWKWDNSTGSWQFYAPGMSATAMQSYATARSYTVLSEIKAGEGYSVNAKATTSLGTLSGTAYAPTTLSSGWSLMGMGNDTTPAAFNTSLNTTPPAAGSTPANFSSLWAWDSASSKWYFYSPALAAQGGSVLADYLTAKGYLSFTTSGKTLGRGVGFWLRK